MKKTGAFLIVMLTAAAAVAAPRSPKSVVEALRKAIEKHDLAKITALLPETGTVRVTSGAGSGDEEPPAKDMDRATLAAELAEGDKTVGARVTCKGSCCKIAHRTYKKDPTMALMTVPVHEICVEAGVVKSVRLEPVGI